MISKALMKSEAEPGWSETAFSKMLFQKLTVMAGTCKRPSHYLFTSLQKEESNLVLVSLLSHLRDKPNHTDSVFRFRAKVNRLRAFGRADKNSQISPSSLLSFYKGKDVVGGVRVNL